MSEYVTISQAQSQLSRLIQKALAGEEIVIVKGKNPVARLVPIQSLNVERQIGADKGLVEIADDCKRLGNGDQTQYPKAKTSPPG